MLTFDLKKKLFFTVKTRQDAAQALWQTPPGTAQASVVQTRQGAAQAL
jgi:hypothetical protein